MTDMPKYAPSEQKPMSWMDHFKEIRTRLMRSTVAVIIGMVMGLFLVLGPVKLVDMIITSFLPTDTSYPPIQAVGTAEEFTSYMMVALVVGIILAMPVIIYQLIAFIKPGLNEKEKRFILIALPFITTFFLAGVAFGWFITVPVAIQFLVGFSNSTLIMNQPTLSDFLRTVTLLVLMNGIVFETPVLIYILAWMNLVTAKQLTQYRRYAVLLVTIIAAVITPTGDPVNLMLLAVPMYILYEVGIIFAQFTPQK